MTSTTARVAISLFSEALAASRARTSRWRAIHRRPNLYLVSVRQDMLGTQRALTTSHPGDLAISHVTQTRPKTEHYSTEHNALPGQSRRRDWGLLAFFADQIA